LSKTYEKQKSQQFAHFRLDKGDLPLLGSSQFTLFNFVKNSFSFSQKKRLLAVKILELLTSGEKAFPELHSTTGSSKSSLYLLLLCLERSGVVEKNKGGKFVLSLVFSNVLLAYAGWWSERVKKATLQQT
jgi:hypothetical protein